MLGKQLQTKWAREARQARKKAARLPPFVPRRPLASTNLQKQESKAFDTALAFTMDATGEVPATGQLCLVQTGDTLNNRDGAVIKITSVQLRGTALNVPAAAATAATSGYIYVMLDKQPNGAAASFSGAATSIFTGANITTALPSVPNQFRFKTLKKIPLIFNSQAGVTTAYNNFVVQFDEFIKFKKPIEIRYNASAGAITDISTNNIFLVAGTDGYSDDTITVDGNARIRFVG